MKFSLLGVNISINRKKSRELVTFKDIRDANDEIISYLQKLPKEEIDFRIKNITCTLDGDIKKTKEVLNENGIVIIPDLVPENLINKLSKDIEKIKKEVRSFISTGKTFKEEKSVLFQQKESKIKGYRLLSSYHKSVVNVRNDQDAGMIDIFNIDKWYNSFGDILLPFYKDKNINEIIHNQNKPLKIKNLNLYLNEGVIKTRGFHVDAYYKQMKGFIYLDDCLELNSGPYTYVKKSHLNSPYRNINKKISAGLSKETETPINLHQNIVPALAKKGTLIISDQGGSHRGLPQTPARSRAVAVMKFD